MLICGCAPYPHHEWVRPSISGKVMDAERLTPINNVHVSVVNQNNEVIVESATNENGEFHIQPQRKFYLFSFFGDLMIEETLVFTKLNYEEAKAKYSMFSTASKLPPTYPLEDVLLKRELANAH